MKLNLNDAEKYRWTFATMSVGYFFLAWFWIERSIRPTVFFGTTWIFLGIVTGSAATYFIARHSTNSRTVGMTRNSSLPVTTMEFPNMTSHSHHNAPSRTKVRN
jgi:hypothetical protein